MDIWGILGIDETAGVDAIRAAYSEKVKDHHPEDDPEGFMRIREAYKAAVRIASGRGAGFTTTVPVTPSAAQKARTAKPQPTEPQPHTDSTNAFDFSALDSKSDEHTFETPEETPPAPAFDFSQLEQDTAEHFARERQYADDFVARATALYKSRSRSKSEKWRELLVSADKSFARGEYFTWAFLDFLAMTPEIPRKAREKAVDTFVAELRGYWQGTLLWGEFDVATRKYVSEGLKKADVTFRVQLGLILLPILVFVAIIRIALLFVPTELNTARNLLMNWYTMDIIGVAGIIVAIVIGVGSQIACNLKIRRTVNRGVSGKMKTGKSMLVVVLIAAVAVLFGLFAASMTSDIREYAADIKQIDEGRLNEDIVNIYRNIKVGDATDRVNVAGVDREDSGRLFGYLTVPKGLNFNPNPSDLLNDRLSVQSNYENGMKDYRITYTDNLKLIVSIVEKP